MNPSYTLLLLLFVARTLLATEVEEIQRKGLTSGVLGTRTYSPSETEKPFLKKASPAEFYPEDQLNPDILKAKTGEYVSWFGIVREISLTPKDSKLRVTLESKYFNGLSDLHLQTVSIHGAGDFTCEIPAKDLTYDLTPLMLVRVYGSVTGREDGIPVVAAEYLRVWPLGYFNFREYGRDGSAPRRREGLQIGGLRIYSSQPSIPAYYAERLATTPAELDAQREWWKKNGTRLNGK